MSVNACLEVDPQGPDQGCYVLPVGLTVQVSARWRGVTMGEQAPAGGEFDDGQAAERLQQHEGQDPSLDPSNERITVTPDAEAAVLTAEDSDDVEEIGDLPPSVQEEIERRARLLVKGHPGNDKILRLARRAVTERILGEQEFKKRLREKSA
jgi:hypothetical protein